MYLHAILKTQLLKFKILLEEGNLLAERNQLDIALLQDRTQEIAEARNHAHGGLIFLFAHQHGNGMQRVEQEMRMELHLERLQLRLRELAFELGSSKLALFVFVIKLQPIANS